MSARTSKSTKHTIENEKKKKEWNENNLKRKYYATYLTRQQKTIIRPKNVMRYSKSAETTQNEKKNRNY